MLLELYNLKAKLEYCGGLADGTLVFQRDSRSKESDSQLTENLSHLSERLGEVIWAVDDVIKWVKELPISIEDKVNLKEN